MGDGKFIGAQSKTGVGIVSMTEGYWKEKFIGRVKAAFKAALCFCRNA